MRAIKFHIFLFLVLSLGIVSGEAQTTSSAKWYTGAATATGKDIEKIRAEALNKARAGAMQKAGIEISSEMLSLKSEGNNKLIDFFSEFAESNAHGLILEERNVRFDHPEYDSTNNILRVTAHLEALVAAPQGSPDPAFHVTFSSERKTYKEYEPVVLSINSTEPGYLSILDIHGDSVTVLFPNEIDLKNYIAAKTDFIFPPSKAYSLELETEKGRSSSQDVLIAVVTKDDIPFPNIDTIGLEGSRLLLAEKALTSYANWLYKIPLDRRSAGSIQLEVQKEDKGND